MMALKHPNPDACIACTTCVVQCPVAQATTNFLGPRMIGPAYERFRLLGLAEEESLHYCANCKNCDIACPQGVPVSSLNMMARAEQCRKKRPPLRDWILGHGELMARLLRYVPARLKNFGMLNPVTRFALDKLGISAKAPMPAFAEKSFRQQLKKIWQPHTNKYVVLFPGCFLDVYDPQTGLDLVWVLNQAGYHVIVPKEFVCCGLPMVANGFWDDARANAKKNIAELQRWRKEGIPVITGCPSCALMFSSDLPEYYPDLMIDGVSTTLLDAQAFLLDCVDKGELRLPEKPWTVPWFLPSSSTMLPAICAPRAMVFPASICSAPCPACMSATLMPAAAASRAAMASKRKNTLSACRWGPPFSMPCAKVRRLWRRRNAAPAVSRSNTAPARTVCTLFPCCGAGWKPPASFRPPTLR